MGNQPTNPICCYDNSDGRCSELLESSSFDTPPQKSPGKRLQKTRAKISAFFVKSPVSKTTSRNTVTDESATATTTTSADSGNKAQGPGPGAIFRMEDPFASPPPPHHQLRTFSSMSTTSEFGDRAREARSERVTRRLSYCSAREDIEEGAEPCAEPCAREGVADIADE